MPAAPRKNDSATASAAAPAVVPYHAIAVLALAAFGSAASLRASDSLLPQIAGEFSTTIGTASIIVTTFGLMYGILQAVFGPVGERLGKYRVIAFATAFSALGSVGCALMPTLGTLAVMRCLAGASAAAIIPLSMAWVGDVVPYQQRQGILAKFLTGQISGLIFGQVVGGIIGEHFGWRVMFLVLAMLYIIAGIMLFAELRKNPVTQSPNALGTLRGLNAASILSAFAPIVKRPWARVCLIMGFLEGVAFFGAFVFVGADLHTRFGLSLANVGLVIAFFGVGGITYAWSAKSLIAYFGERGLVGWGGAVIALAYVMIASFTQVWTAALSIFGLGLGFYMLHNTLQTNATQMAPEARGVGVSLFASCLFFGQSIGVALAGLIVDGWGPRPIFVLSAFAILALSQWFREQLRWRA